MAGRLPILRGLLRKIGIIRAVGIVVQFLGFSLAPRLGLEPSRVGSGLRGEPEVMEGESLDCLVFLCSGAELVPFLSNAIKSLRKYEAEVPIFAFCDGASAQLCSEVLAGLNVNIRPLSEIADDSATSYASFGTREFNRSTNQKWEIISRLFDEGYELVIFSDVDIVFLNSFVSYIRRCASIFPAGFQSEGQRAFPPTLCTGFMYFRKSWRFQLSEITRFANATSETMNDQDALNALLASSPALQRGVYELPGAVFPNGPLRPIVENYLQTKGPGLSVALFHANFCNGLQEKRALLEELGLWNLN